MKTNRALLFAAIAVSALCVALAWSSVVTANRVRDLTAQIEAQDAEVQRLNSKKRGDSVKNAAADADMGELLAKRDAEYQELREAYDKLREQLATAPTVNIATTSATTRTSFTQFPRRNNNNFLERIRQQDPERYKQVVQQIQQRQQQAAQDYDDQITGLAARAQAAPTPEEADLVNQIKDTLDKINELRQSRQALANLPEDQIQAQMQPINDQLREAYGQLTILRDKDRTSQLLDLATQLGLKGSEAQNLADGVTQVYKNTQYHPPRGQGGPGGFGGPGGGPNTSPQPSTQSQPSSSSTTK
jgi:hypothetical protein